MRKLDISYKIYSYIIIFSILILAGCSRKSDSFIVEQSVEMQTSEETTQIEDLSTEEIPQIMETITDEVQEENAEPIIVEVDWSNYFDGINGAAVIYDPIENCYQIYNQELSLTQRSPCSTFKIISSLIALENGIIEPDDSTRTWSGEIF